MLEQVNIETIEALDCGGSFLILQILYICRRRIGGAGEESDELTYVCVI